MSISKYRVLSGAHYQNSTLYHTGDIVQSVERLDQVFPGKFELVGEAVERVFVSQTTDNDSPLGENVTGRFIDPASQPDDSRLLVFYRGRKYYLHDESDLMSPVVSDGMNRKQMREYVEKYLNTEAE